MLDSLQSINISLSLPQPLITIASLVGISGLIFWIGYSLIPNLLGVLVRWFVSPEADQQYQKVVASYRMLSGLIAWLTVGDIALLQLRRSWVQWTEIGVSFTLAITLSWVITQLFKDFFNSYILDQVFKGGRKTNSELIIVGRLLINAAIVLVILTVFAETHDINIIGLFASLGIGGLAIAFAAQKTLEQLLGGVVLLVDRPFTIDDYIGLPDGTFGRVESIGLRSTRIRTTAKGTLIIVPNSSLAQSSVENFTGAKKIMAILYLNFYRDVSGEEQALIRQVVTQSTSDIYGIDSRSTDITFRKPADSTQAIKNQAQCTFFILGSGSVSTELRRQLLDIASQKLAIRLQEYGITFDIEEPTIYVDSPITI